MNRMNRLGLLAAIVFIVMVLSAFRGNARENVDTTDKDKELTCKEALLSRISEAGKMTTVPDGSFRRGDSVHLVIRDAGPFTPGPDGKHHFDIDMIVEDPKGAVILEQKGLLGDKGVMTLEDNIASSPYGIYDTTVTMDPGTYLMHLTLRDVISGKKLTVSREFILKDGLSYQTVLFAKNGEDGKLERVDEAVFARGETVNMVLLNVGKFQKGLDGKHSFDINMTVKNHQDQVILNKNDMLGEDGHFFLENDIAESPYGMFHTDIGMNAGEYFMTLEIFDRLSGHTLGVTRKFTLN